MRRCSLALGLVLLLAVLLPVPRRTAAEASPLVLIAHPSLSLGAIHVTEVRSLFLRQAEFVGGQRVVPLTYPAGHPLRVLFAARVLAMTEDELGRYWVDARIRGIGTPPRMVASPQQLVRIVAALPGALGYAPQDVVGSAPVKVLKMQGLTPPL